MDNESIDVGREAQEEITSTAVREYFLYKIKFVNVDICRVHMASLLSFSCSLGCSMVIRSIQLEQ